MRKLIYLSTLLVTAIFCSNTSYSQEFSNKGKDFWITSGWHYGMGANNPPVMTLSLTSDVNTTYSIEAYGVGVINSGTITANQVTIVNIPSNYFTYVPATGAGDGLFTGKAIHVTSVKPIVIYSFTTQSLSSAATLCLPTNVLGKQYYAASYTQLSANPTGNNFITIIAVEDNTTVEIIPTQSTVGGWAPNSVNTVNLNKGEIYQVLGAMSGNSGSDLTGTSIRSISSTSGGCKRIAVFSGSGRVWIGAGCNNGADNLYQQLYPASTWGRKYLTVPSSGRATNYYRIIRPAGATTANITLNGTLIPAASFVNNFYQFNNTTPNLIEADTSICVVQYFTSANCIPGNGNPYDPDMVILNPVEQNISDVTLISSDRLNHTPTTPQHYIHVIMRNGGTGISSFKFDGGGIPIGSNWVTHPQDPSYSYLYLNNVSETYHSLSSDSGFNAIAYGYANFETYAYSAGTNVKDLYTQLGFVTLFGSSSSPAACVGTGSKFKVSFPYAADSILWHLNQLPGSPNDTLTKYPPSTFDSTTVVNGVTLYWYSLPSVYFFNSTGSFPVTITVYAASNVGCGSEQEYEFEVEVYPKPLADFNFTTDGCVTNPVLFADNSTPGGRPIFSQYWNFDDPGSGANNTSAIGNPSHTFSTSGLFNVKYTYINDIGCRADTVSHIVTLSDPPVAGFTSSGPYCINKQISFTDVSTSTGGAITVWNWDFGDGNSSNSQNPVHTYSTAGVYNVTLTVQTASGCSSIAFTTQVTVFDNPTSDFSIPTTVCLPSGAAQFNDLSTAPAGGSVAAWQWNFGDGSPVSNIQNPLHNYSGTGPYNVTLQVTSDQGCVDTKVLPINTIYAEPQAQFNSLPEVCVGSLIGFSDMSSAPGSSVTGWSWDFGDGSPVSTSQNPSHIYNLPGTYTISLTIQSASGCQSQPYTSQVIVNHIPTADFSIASVVCVPAGEAQFNDLSSVPAGSTISTWNWDFGDGSTSTTQNPTHIYASTGSYTVTLNVVTDKGCAAPFFTKDVSVSDRPLAGFTPPQICTSDMNAPFFDNSTIAAGTVTGWEWDFGDPGSGANNTSVLQNPTHTYSTVGTYTAQLIAVSAQGCKDTIQQQFVVNGSVPIADFNVQNSTTLCSNQEISIQDASSVDFGSIIKAEIY
ncbi:MAG TPA: PKD domain-containing protein, partial [Chitinophagaceae bacterium]|nr:PKD domain-containing protein [Chitinophagaceae bacterium]